MKIECRTLFDCSATGITGRFNRNQLPMTDRLGNHIQDQTAWNLRRNQQRNWETLLQIIQLRSQVDIVQPPIQRDQSWCFEFAVDNDAVYGTDLEYLYADAHNIPMMIALGDQGAVSQQLICHGPQQNIWFRAINT